MKKLFLHICNDSLSIALKHHEIYVILMIRKNEFGSILEQHDVLLEIHYFHTQRKCFAFYPTHIQPHNIPSHLEQKLTL